MSVRKKLIVIGGGFAGIQLVRNLDENLFDILLIDKINHHQFQPLFYQVATSQIEPSSISFPLRNIFKNKKNLQIRLAEVTAVDTITKNIVTSIGDFEYDYLVMAMGCTTNFFGNTKIEKNALTLKSTYDAITIRNHIIQTFEDIISADEIEKSSLYNLVIVGAGPTGVELSGAFAEIKSNILPKDYPAIDFSKFNVILVEGSKHTLNNMSEKSKVDSQKYLTQLGVKLYTELFVKDYDGAQLTLSNGEVIPTKTVIWSAGVIGNSIEGFPVSSITPSQRLKVNRFNQVDSVIDVFAIGDICYMETPNYPKGHPQVANVAINQAKLLAKNLKKIILQKSTREYEYRDLGSMATIGRNKAVADISSFHFRGYFAWLIWMFLHLMLILSVKNKLIIFIQWAWAYVTKDTSLRLILTPSKRKNLSG